MLCNKCGIVMFVFPCILLIAACGGQSNSSAGGNPAAGAESKPSIIMTGQHQEASAPASSSSLEAANCAVEVVDSINAGDNGASVKSVDPTCYNLMTSDGSSAETVDVCTRVIRSLPAGAETPFACKAASKAADGSPSADQPSLSGADRAHCLQSIVDDYHLSQSKTDLNGNIATTDEQETGCSALFAKDAPHDQDVLDACDAISSSRGNLSGSDVGVPPLCEEYETKKEAEEEKEEAAQALLNRHNADAQQLARWKQQLANWDSFVADEMFQSGANSHPQIHDRVVAKLANEKTALIANIQALEEKLNSAPVSSSTIAPDAIPAGAEKPSDYQD